MGIRDRPTAPQSPWQNGHTERLIGSIRRECLDHVVVFGERHLRHILLSYMHYYNGARTHLSLNKMCRYRGLFRPSGAFSRHPCSADYTIPMFGFDFRQGQLAGCGRSAFARPNLRCLNCNTDATPTQFPLGLPNTRESDLKVSFHGADRSVTGSCHLVECAGKRILIDCRLHPGSRELDEENAEPFGFDAAGINYLLLTHERLDHCGRLPLLAKRGFRGEIITTSVSRELVAICHAGRGQPAGGRRALP